MSKLSDNTTPAGENENFKYRLCNHCNIIFGERKDLYKDWLGEKDRRVIRNHLITVHKDKLV